MAEFVLALPRLPRTNAAYANRWSSADIRLLRDMAQQGVPLRVIARSLGRSESALRNKAAMHGISLQRKGAAVTDA
jgi:hypothetical protein